MNLGHSLSVLQVTDLHFSYPDHSLFAGLSTSISQGVTLIRGGDGRGKSTLLRLLAGTLPMQSGRLNINGVGLLQEPEKYKAQLFWVEPRSVEFDQLGVLDYFELIRSQRPRFDDAALPEVIEGLGLKDHLHKQLFMLSTGSKRKVFLAAAFASGTAVTLLDEPFAALDAPSIGFILNWLKRSVSDDHRIWVMADYRAPNQIPLVQTIELGD